MSQRLTLTLQIVFACFHLWQLISVGCSLAHEAEMGATSLSKIDLQNRLAAAMLMAAEQAETAVKDDPFVDGRIANEVCYDEFGCFKKDPIGELPEPPEQIQPRLTLFIKESKLAVKEYQYNSTLGDDTEEILKALQDKSRNLVFVTHGFGGSGHIDWIQEVVRVTTERYSSNIIVVDWERGARYSTLYTKAAANSVVIGRIAALFCLRLTTHYEISLERVHFVGFSLGGQVAGFFAAKIFDDSRVKIGKITALDTAAPLFEPAGVFPRKEHTTFLEAVHTSAGNSVWRGKLGIEVNYGHVDYYPNGGIDQPGCNFPDIGCAHHRAVEYYIEALKNKDRCRYHGFPCTSVDEAQVGRCGFIIDRQHYMSMSHRRGKSLAILYLKTNSTSPYCLTDVY